MMGQSDGDGADIDGLGYSDAGDDDGDVDGDGHAIDDMVFKQVPSVG